MAHHRLGNGTEAAAALERLRESMQENEQAQDRWYQAFLAEAERLIEKTEDPQ